MEGNPPEELSSWLDGIWPEENDFDEGLDKQVEAAAPPLVAQQGHQQQHLSEEAFLPAPAMASSVQQPCQVCSTAVAAER